MDKTGLRSQKRQLKAALDTYKEGSKMDLKRRLANKVQIRSRTVNVLSAVQENVNGNLTRLEKRTLAKYHLSPEDIGALAKFR